MNDVLPKPFTRKSLLDMLERHLDHLKISPRGTGLEQVPPSAAAVTMAAAAQNSATQSIKEDSSPGQSPAGSMNNWQSPGPYQNMQAVPPNMPAVQGPYVTAPPAAYTVDQNGVQYPAPPPVGVPPAGAAVRPPHRRQISDMSSATENPNMPKRQRMYSQPQAQPQPQQMLAMQAGRPG
jgi:osomolarity two-component system response regulator SKN7